MNTAMRTIESYGIPIESAINAIQHVNGLGILSKDKYDRRISEIASRSFVSQTDHLARFTYLYLIQDIIKQSKSPDDVDMDFLFGAVTTKAATFVDTHPWSLIRTDDVDADGNPKPRSETKGAKRMIVDQLYQDHRHEMTKSELIDLFTDQANMTRSGASTYFYAMKKLYGPEKKTNPTDAKRNNKASKQSMADDVYTEHKDTHTKNEMIEALQEALNTTRSGATTYFYKMKKTHGVGKNQITEAKNKETKASIAIRLYNAHPELSPSDMIELLMKELSTSKAGATTQFYNAKKNG